MQKVILARVLDRRPMLVVAAQPTRGLDVGASEYVRSKLLEQRSHGAAVLLISEDLDEVLALSDRIAVLSSGQIIGTIPAAAATAEQLGLMMAGRRYE
jgi:simple sugar transport system ATP-binding protein